MTSLSDPKNIIEGLSGILDDKMGPFTFIKYLKDGVVRVQLSIPEAKQLFKGIPADTLTLSDEYRVGIANVSTVIAEVIKRTLYTYQKYTGLLEDGRRVSIELLEDRRIFIVVDGEDYALIKAESMERLNFGYQFNDNYIITYLSEAICRSDLIDDERDPDVRYIISMLCSLGMFRGIYYAKKFNEEFVEELCKFLKQLFDEKTPIDYDAVINDTVDMDAVAIQLLAHFYSVGNLWTLTHLGIYPHFQNYDVVNRVNGRRCIVFKDGYVRNKDQKHAISVILHQHGFLEEEIAPSVEYNEDDK